MSDYSNPVIHIGAEGHCLVALPYGSYRGGCWGPWQADYFLRRCYDGGWTAAAAAIERHERGQPPQLVVPDGLRELWLAHARLSVPALPAGLQRLYLDHAQLDVPALPAGLRRLRLVHAQLDVAALPDGLHVSMDHAQLDVNRRQA